MPSNGGCGTAVAPRPRWMKLSARPRGSTILALLHQEGVQFVAVRIAEVARIEAFAARARGAFVAAAVGEREIVKPLYLVAVLRLEGDHDSVAHARGVPV